MTRDEAIEAMLANPLSTKYPANRDQCRRRIDQYVALGMLKLEVPLTQREQFEKKLRSYGFDMGVAAIMDAFDEVQS